MDQCKMIVFIANVLTIYNGYTCAYGCTVFMPQALFSSTFVPHFLVAVSRSANLHATQQTRGACVGFPNCLD